MPLPIRTIAYLVATLSGASLGYSVPGGFGDSSAAQTVAAINPPLASVVAVTTTAAAPEDQTPVVTKVKATGRTTGGWTVRSEVSGFDNLANVFLSVPSDQPLRCGPRRRATLMLRCLQDRTAVYVAHDCATPPGDPDGWEVEQRLDGSPVSTVRMEVDSQGEAFGHWQYRPARTFIEDLTNALDLHLRFENAGGLISEIRFPLAGLTDVLPTLSAACHWSDVAPWAVAEPIASVAGSLGDERTEQSDRVTSFDEPRGDPTDLPLHLSAPSAPTGDSLSKEIEDARPLAISTDTPGPDTKDIQIETSITGDPPNTQGSEPVAPRAGSSDAASTDVGRLSGLPSTGQARVSAVGGGTDPPTSDSGVRTANAPATSTGEPVVGNAAPRLLLGERWLKDYTRGNPPKD